MQGIIKHTYVAGFEYLWERQRMYFHSWLAGTSLLDRESCGTKFVLFDGYNFYSLSYPENTALLSSQ